MAKEHYLLLGDMKIEKEVYHSEERFLLIRNPRVSAIDWVPGQARHDEIKLTGQ